MAILALLFPAAERAVCVASDSQISEIENAGHTVWTRVRNFGKKQPPAGRHRPSSRSIPVDKIYTYRYIISRSIVLIFYYNEYITVV